MKLFEKKSSKKGNMLIGVATAAVAVAILLFIAILLISKVRGAIDRTDFTADDNTTFDEVSSNVNTALTLVAIGVLVLAAVAIVAFVRNGMG